MESTESRIRYSMKKKSKFIHRVVQVLELPQDLDPHLIAVRWIGGSELLIEQHRGILRFDGDVIRFASEQGAVSVSGSEMVMEQMTETSAMIKGDICSVCFEDKS